MREALASAPRTAVPEEVRALLDALPVAATLLSASGEVLHANPVAAGRPATGETTRVRLPGLGECVLLVASAAADPQTQRLASMGFMLAGICHEVSNPLAAVSSMVQILQSKRGVSAETLAKGLASIASNIQRVLAITKRLGDFSRVPDPPVPVEIDQAVEGAASLLRHSPAGHAVALDYRGAPGVQVLARPGELEQVVFNILLNGAQAMGGTGRIEARASAGARQVVLAVRDHGPGIPPEHLPRLFDAFFTTKQPGEGTGLGLAVSYEIVQELKGSLRASNHPAGGACFEIELPIAGRAA